MAECFEMKHFIFLLISIGLTSTKVLGSFKDVALERPATQSTTFEEQGVPLSAGLATDNDPDTCSETEKASDQYWQVDLGKSYNIGSLNIYTGSRSLLPLDVHVGNSDPPKGLCAYYNGQSGNSSNSDVIECYSSKNARYIRFSSSKQLTIYLCTVEVPQCDGGYFGTDCTNRCHCSGDVPCDKVSGQCPDNLCAKGWEGDQCQSECLEGTFGENCKYQCHCKGDPGCDIKTGTCSIECDGDYIGESCQTETPSLANIAPTMFTKSQNFIVLQWESWKGYIEPPPTMHLFYQVEFRKHGESNWMKSKDFLHVPGPLQQESVRGLHINTFYNFRVLPKIEYRGEKIEGEHSKELGPVKTSCAAPASPVIDNVTTTTDPDNSEQAALLVLWTKLDPSDVNCDNVKQYQVMYQSTGDSKWKQKLAGPIDAKRIIGGLKHSTEYRIRVVVVNNMNIEASSPPMEIVTQDETGATILENGGSEMAIIAGVVIVVVAIIIVVLILVCYKRKRSKYNTVPTKDPEDGNVMLNNLVKDKNDSPTGDSGVVDGSSDVTPSSMLNVLDNGIGNHRFDVPPKPAPRQPPREHKPIKVEELEDYVNARCENDRQELRNEYKDLPDAFHHAYDHGSLPENKHKNRFVNVVAYDHSRVILDKVEGDPDSDYINASYIDGYKQKQQYIASQGCNKFTIQDMWRMVWQVNSFRIVMVTNLVENGKRKCEQYWIDEENKEKFYGDIGVTLLDTETTSDFVVRTFNMRKGDDHRNVKQFHFTAWPDHGVPTRASPLITFRRKVRSYDESHGGIIVIHCSAGVGRTGTFIAVDSLLDQAKAEGTVDVYGFTKSMRKDRVNMIQTVEQYLLVYDALLEALKTGNTAIDCAEFKEKYEQLRCQTNPATGKSKLVQEFEKLKSMSPKLKAEDCKSGTLPENLEKNRFTDQLPADRHRPYLMTRVQGTNDYINAIFLDGHRSKNQYIVTQMPLPHTVIDLWRMIHEHSCGSIIMLNPEDESDESYGQYWPDENEECECGPFMIGVSNVDTTTNPEVTVRELTLQYNDQNSSKKEEEPKARQVNQFLLTCWPKDKSVPTSKAALINLIDLVDRSQLKTGNGPILIHCHNGVLQSGLYAAVSCIWEKMKVDQEVDIYHTVKQLRFHLPNVVQDLEQYQFCFEMVLAYLAEFETYSNFR